MKRPKGIIFQTETHFRSLRAYFSCLSIKRKIIWIAFLIFLFVSILFATIFGSLFSRANRQESNRILNQVFINANLEVERYFEKLDTEANEVRFSNWIQQLLQQSTVSSNSERQLIKRNAAYFLNSVSTISGGNHFYIITLDGECINQTASFLQINLDIQNQEWLDELLINGRYIDESIITYRHQQSEDLYIRVYYPITDISTFDHIGYLMIYVPSENIFLGFESAMDQQYICLLGKENKMIAEVQSATDFPVFDIEKLQNFDNGQTQENGNIIITREMAPYGWKLIAVGADMTNTSPNQEYVPLAVLIFLLAVLVILLLALTLARYLTAPILRCKDALLAIQNRQLGIQIQHNYHDEFGDLLNGFNQMSSTLSDLIEKNKLIDSLQRDTEFEMLLQKINPHFLYNTLDMINGLILAENSENAVRICETLGQMFHYNLLEKRHVTLREEMTYIKQYLLIAEFKLDSLVTSWEVQDSILESIIPKMILQPFLENAIQHGFLAQSAECCLTITARKNAEKTEIIIMDNGLGMSPEKRAEILLKLEKIRHNKERKSQQGNIGISNTYQRLYLEYGDALSFDIVSKERFGTQITIGLPQKEILI